MKADITLDTKGLLCPMPVLKTQKKIKEMSSGQILEVLTDDQGAKEDFPAWCEQTGNEFLGIEEEGETIKVFIKKA